MKRKTNVKRTTERKGLRPTRPWSRVKLMVFLNKLTEEELLSNQTGVTSDEWERISDTSVAGKVFWSYREPEDSIGFCAAVMNRDDADHILVCKMVDGAEVFHNIRINP